MKTNQQFIKIYSDIIDGKDTRTENLEENPYSLDRDKNLCAEVKNQESYKFDCLP